MNEERKTMDAKQVRIFDWLMQVDSGLAELYHGAVKMLRDENFPGRGRLVCHCVREIRNRLPNAVAGKATLSRLDYAKEINKLARAYEKAGLGSIHESKEQNETGKLMGYEVLTLLHEIIKKHEEVKNIKQENAKQLLMELEPENKRMQQSLIPIVGKWIEETEWFVQRAHEGKEIIENQLLKHFAAFEEVILSLIGHFYEGMQELEGLVRQTNGEKKKPDKQLVNKILRMLGRAKYRIYFFDKLTNPYWIGILKEAGFFQNPPEPKPGEVYDCWLEGGYLKNMSQKIPDKVLSVIVNIQSRNPYVRDDCIECLCEMPEEISAKGVKVIENVLPRGVEEDNWGWTWCGEKAAKLMVRLADKYLSQAFEISWILLDVWLTQDQKGYRNIKAKFTTHDYTELVLKYFIKLWEVDTWKAIWIMFKILNRCLEKLDKRDGYDVSSIFYAGQALRDLDSIQVGHWSIEAVLVKGICEAGKLLCKNNPTKLSKLLDVFEKSNRAIFLRIEMYLLRFVRKDVEIDRTNKIISEKKFLGDPCYENEYKLLLRDKFNEVEESRKVFETWVEEQKVEDLEEWREWFRKTREREANEEDLNRYVAGMKARQLFLLKEIYPANYAKYQSESGLTHEDLVPHWMISEAHWVSPMEGTPLEPEEMAKMSEAEVLDYILNPKNYEGDKKPGQWGTPADALRATFKADVNKRSLEYLECDSEKLQKLHPDFLGALFYGIQDAIRAGNFSISSWPKLIILAHKIVQQNFGKENYRNCFLPLLSVMHDDLTQEDRKIDFNETIIEFFWDILEALVRYEEHYQASSDERDPMQMRCTSVNGEALEQVVMLGISCKQEFPKYYEEHLKAKIREVLNYVTTEVKRPEVNCTLGIDLGRIGWLDEEWLSGNIEKIFEGEMWDVVWGTHVSWGRPYRHGFYLLKQNEIYENAISKLGTPNKFKFGKDPEEGFAEHMMIAIFNGWIDVDDELVDNFFHRASQELRSYAARFLTTGFKPEKESGEDYQEVSERLRTHWKKRLEAIKKEPSVNIEEAIGFTGWVKDSLLEPKETLELLEETLQLSGGRLGRLLDTRDFVEGVCELSKGNELAALRCLKKAAAEEEMRMPWAAHQDPLIEFLQSIADLSDDHEDIEKIRAEAIAVADAYGRLHPDKFREVWVKLTQKEKKE
jgi:hypothetical protein